MPLRKKAKKEISSLKQKKHEVQSKIEERKDKGIDCSLLYRRLGTINNAISLFEDALKLLPEE